MSMSRLSLWAALLPALLTCACSGPALQRPGDGPASGGGAAALPGLPALSELAADMPAGPRRASLNELIQIPSNSYIKASIGSNDNPPNLTFGAPFGRLGYALYQAGPFDSNFQLLKLQLIISDVQNDYFFFLPDWNTGRWECIGGPRVLGFTHSFAEDYARYISPAGDFFFAIVTDGGFVVYEHAELSVNNLTPLPAPTGLICTPGDGAVQLDWDVYNDPRADSVDAYFSTSLDMSGATLSQSLDPGISTWTVEGLNNGTLYYFGLKASNADGSGVFSELATATPTDGTPLPFKLAEGLWPRYGNTVDGSGTTMLRNGPPNLSGFFAVDLGGSPTDANRSSPVLDAAGNVYALSRSGALRSYSSDLLTLRYSFDANDYAAEGISFVCPPQAPCLDADGNAYFVVAEKGSSVHDGFLFGVKPTGALLFQHNLGTVKDDPSRPYSSPNIGPGGVLLAVAEGQSQPLALNQDGSEAWLSDNLTASLRFYADPVYNAANDCFNWPATFEGFSIGLVEHCISILQSDGTELADSDYRDLGTPVNLAGGCALSDDLFIYPENGLLLLINSTLGVREDVYALGGNPQVGPSRVADSDYLVQPVPTDGSQFDLSELRGVRLDNSGLSPELGGPFWTFSLGSGDVHSRTAVDKNGRIYAADDSGKLWLVWFDYTQPPSIGSNPVLLDSREPDGSNTFYFNSFAIGTEAVYIVSEQNKLILLYNPLD